MNFLFPLYLLGAAAVVVPLILHLRRRPPQNVIPFSAMMFLEAAPVPPVKRRKLEDLLLLALRCLALLLLALMFSRPLWGGKEFASVGARSQVILIDRSASMRRDDIRAQMTAKFDEALRDVREEDQVSLVAFDRESQIIVSAEAWTAQPVGARKPWLRSQMNTVEPGWAATDLGGALVFAAGLLDSGKSNGESASQRRITVVSDFQEGAALETLGGFAWPQDVAVAVIKAEPKSLDNFTVSVAARDVDEDGARSQNAASSSDVRVRVANTRESIVTKFALKWKGDAKAKPVEGEVVPGSSRVVNVPAQDGAGDGAIEVTGDKESFDNEVWFAHAASRTARILVVAENTDVKDAKSPAFFLSRALKAGAGIEPQIAMKKPLEVAEADSKSADLVIVTSPLAEAQVEILKNWLTQNHTLLWVASPNENGTAFAKLAGLDGLSFSEAKGKYAMLGEVHFEHPLMKPFAESNVRDFSKIRFWKHRVATLPDKSRLREIASFDDGSPAIAEAMIGKGRAFLLASGWTAEESQLGVSSKFVPLLYSVLASAGFGAAQNETLVVGDAIPIDATLQTESLKVTTPDGKTQMWNAKENPLFTATNQPGIYRFGEGAGARSHAVNLAASEGRIAPMDMERLREFGIPLTENAEAMKHFAESQTQERAALEDVRREQRQKLWRIFAATALLVLLLETFVATRFRKVMTPQPAAS